MRVAVVTESFLPQVNGVTNSVLRVLETLKQKEHEAIVIAPSAPGERHLGFPVVSSGAFSLKQFPIGVPRPAVSRVLEDFRPDVIHVAAPFMLGAQALIWGRNYSVPTVAIYQTDVAGYLERYNLSFAKPVMERLVASIHNQATVNLAPTPQSAQYLRNLGVNGIGVWGRGVDTDLFTPAHRLAVETQELRSRLAPSGEILVGFVGRLAAEKQVHRMAELFGLRGFRFVIVGDGPERENLEEQFAGAPVTFLGELSALDLARAYSALDVFVHFGTEETFGQTIQEAQASGLPVIAPASGGPLHLIDQGRTGILVDHVEGSYAEALLTLRSLQRRRQLGSSAHAAVQRRSWAANNALLLDWYSVAAAKVSERENAEFELA